MIRRAVDKALAPEVLSGRKITTIRGEPWPVGRPIMLYSWSGHPYRTKQVDVAAIIVTEFCGIGITHRPDGVMLYSHEMHLERPLYDCEGFATQEDMDAWFRQAVPRGTLYAQRALMRFRLWEGAEPIIRPDPAGNWHEDAGHENGRYQRECLECGALFVGHKRRHICRKCHHEAKEKHDKMTPEERAALIQRVDAKVRAIWATCATCDNWSKDRMRCDYAPEEPCPPECSCDSWTPAETDEPISQTTPQGVSVDAPCSALCRGDVVRVRYADGGTEIAGVLSAESGGYWVTVPAEGVRRWVPQGAIVSVIHSPNSAEPETRA